MAIILKGSLASEITVTTCDFEEMTISCIDDETINIISVFYGRTDQTTCRESCIHLFSMTCLSKRLTNTNCQLLRILLKQHATIKTHVT